MFRRSHEMIREDCGEEELDLIFRLELACGCDTPKALFEYLVLEKADTLGYLSPILKAAYLATRQDEKLFEKYWRDK
jgi:hypothetical protein